MFSWSLFFLLFAMSMFGAVAVLPYAFTLNSAQLAQVKMPRSRLVLLTLLQNAVMFALATGLGLLAAGAVGLKIPVLQSLLDGQPPLPILLDLAGPAILVGVIAALITLALEQFVFSPRLPQALREASGRASLGKRFLAAFYGGISEEILLRLFVFSGIVWLLSRFNAGRPTDSMFWLAALLAAVLFGLGHLPATVRITPLTRLIVLRALLLNGIVGLAAAVLFWRYGLEAAMIAHFIGDMFLVVLPGFFNRPKDLTLRPAPQQG